MNITLLNETGEARLVRAYVDEGLGLHRSLEIEFNPQQVWTSFVSTTIDRMYLNVQNLAQYENRTSTHFTSHLR